MANVPPHYSKLPPMDPPLVLEYIPPPPPPPRPDAPYPIGSRWELRSSENAVVDTEHIDQHPGVLHNDDFVQNKEYPRGTVVEIVGHVSRRYKVSSPPLHRDFVLYIVCVQCDHPCYCPEGPEIPLLPDQIKEDTNASRPLMRILAVEDRACILADIKDGPEKNTPIVISHVEISLSRKIMGKQSIFYRAYVLKEKKWTIRYFIEKQLTHDELRPIGHNASSQRGANAQSSHGNTRSPPSRPS